MSNSAAPQATRWILDAPRDLALFVATPLLILPAFFLAQSQWTGVQVAAFVTAFGALGHHLPGMLRAYGDQALFQRFKTRFIVAPIFLLLFCVFFAIRDLAGVMVVVLTWGVWHGFMQTYGFLRIYDAKVGSFSPRTAHLDFAMCAAWFGSGFFFSGHQFYKLLDYFYRIGVPTIPASWIESFREVWLGGTLVVTVLFALHWIQNHRSGQSASSVKLLLMGMSIAFWWFCMALPVNMIVGVAMFEVFHDSQYLSIVWLFNRKRVDTGAGVGRFSRFLFRGNYGMLGLYLGMVFAYGAWGYFDEQIPNPLAVKVFAGLVAASALLHFYFDGFIWKVRENETRSSLGIHSGGVETESKPLISWNRHGLKWLIFVLPVVWMGVSQWRSEIKEIKVNEMLAKSLPNNSIAHHNFAIELESNGYLDRAIVELEQTVAINDRHPNAQRHLGEVLLQAGRLVESRAAFHTALIQDPGDARVLLGLGQVSVAERAYEAALPYLTQAETDLSDDPDLYRAQAISFANTGQVGRAIEASKRVVELTPNDSGARMALALILNQSERVDEAIAELNALLKRDPLHIQAHDVLGRILLTKNELEMAASHFESILVHQPRHEAALMHLAKIRVMEDDLDGAEKYLEEARKVNPTTADFELAMVTMKRGRLLEAQQVLHGILEREPDHPGSLFYLGHIASSLEQWEKAEGYFERLVALDPQNERVRQRLEAARSRRHP